VRHARRRAPDRHALPASDDCLARRRAAAVARGGAGRRSTAGGRGRRPRRPAAPGGRAPAGRAEAGAMSDGRDDLATAIAVVGMAGRFPGARDLAAFWRNLREGRESIRRVTPAELREAGVPAAVVADPDYVGARGVLDDAAAFDAAFFGYVPSDAEVMDPQHRVFLECAWAALEDAGYDPLAAPGLVAVFGGMSQSAYQAVIRALDPHEEKYGAYPVRLGTDKDYLTTRVSYKLNLRGPSLNVQTACSTSLVAIAQACQSLLAFQCDMALAGGVAVGMPLGAGHLHREGGIFSSDGRCRPFDARADGTVNGDGVGLVVLKRLADALADGDAIRAVVRGSAINNDGASRMSLAAPSPAGQAEAIATALAVAGVSPDTITYVEAHGTGTPLGDPIEIAGLTQAFRTGTDRRGYCAIGSVKGNIGHTDTAAGVAGFIKTVLALEHAELPPSLHFVSPNPALGLDDTPFRVNATRTPWTSDGTPRRAGVSGFGLGGTNAHVVLEEAPAHDAAPSRRAWHVVPVSARTPEALAAAASRVADAIEACPGTLPDAAFTLQVGRHAFAERAVAVGRTGAEVASALRVAPRVTVPGAAPRRVAFLFPGGGAQYPDMARGLYEAEPAFRADVDRGLAILADTHGIDLRRWWFPADRDRAEAAARLEQPLHSIASVFVSEYALARLWMAWGVTPAACAGHSLGEYAAACVAGVFDLDDALRVVVARGRIFERMAPGGMLGVLAPEADVRARLTGRLSLAAVNAPGAVVVSGPADEIAALAASLDAVGLETQRVRIAVAAHSALLDPFLDEFRAVMRGVTLAPPSLPIVSSRTGRRLAAAEATDPDYWVAHLRDTVRFADALATLGAEGDLVFAEVGPGRTLTSLTRQQPLAPAAAVHSLRHPTDDADDVAVMLTGLGQLWAHGVDVSWPALHRDEARRRVSLPTYPFARTRCWPSAPAAADDAPPPTATTPDAPAAVAAPADDIDMTPPSRIPRLLDEMARVLHGLSGRPLTAADHATTFLDLGFDSLFLGQASLAFQKTFGVKLRFRDFMETAPTPASLAALLDTKLPSDRFTASAASPAATRAPGGASTATSPADAAVTPAVPVAPETAVAPMPSAPAPPSAPPLPVAPAAAGASVVERVMAQQLQAVLELSRQQLAALGHAPVEPAAAPLTPAAARAAVATPAPLASAASSADAATTPIKVFAQAIVHDPTGIEWAPVDAAADRGLTPRQRAALDALVREYCGRTARSKAMTDEMRPYLADPRAIVGFAPTWKETVYQIVSERSLGSRLWDVDGNEWIDVTLGFGSSAYGHSPDFVVEAIRAQLDRGFELGTQSALAAEAGRLFVEITGHERVCFCTAGTEAVMGAMRLARAYTGRDRVAMFIGDTHGRLDEVLGRPVVADGEYSALPAAAGIAPHGVKPTLFLEYGDPKSLEILERYADDLAAVLVEPVRTRSPDLQPFQFLRDLRELARRRGITFIMDEVVTGFRVHPGGAQQLLGLDPDLSTWGKAVAAGMPVGAISGKAEYMDALDGGDWRYGDGSVPEARMTNFGGAGTFAKHPLAMAATVATLRHILAQGPALQAGTAAKAERLVTTLNTRFREQGLPVHLERFSTFFVPRVLGDRRFEPLLFVYLRNEGIHTYVDYPCFICTAHSDADIDALIARFVRAVDAMARGGFLSAPAGGGTGSGRVTSSSTSGAGTAPAASMAGAAHPVAADGPAGDATALPLTPAQAEIWLATQRGDEGGAAFTLSSSIHLHGPLDHAALRRAAADLVARHEALRVTVAAGGSCQVVGPPGPVDVPVVDCTGDDGEGAATAFLATETSTAFDPATGPLIRFTVLARRADWHTLVVSAFHMVCDGWSLGMICRDLSLLYSAHATGAVPALPPAVPFRDYVAWRAEPAQQDDAATSLAYWSDQFRDGVPVLDLPARGPRPRPKTFHAARHRFALDAAATHALRQAAARRGCTLFAATVASFSLLLHRITGQADVVVGLGAAGQAAVGADNLIGHCVSLLPYRSRLDVTATLADFLTATRRQLIDAYDHQGCSYGDLLGHLNLPRDPTRLPLVNAIVTHETDTAGIGFTGLRHEIAGNPVPYCNFDVELYLVESADGVSGTLVYNRDLFDAAATAAWRDDLVALLDAVVRQADRLLGDLPALDAGAEERLRAWGRGADLDAGASSVPAAFEAQAARTPDAVAVTCGDEHLTYRDLNARANRLARVIGDEGAAPGARVALALDRSIASVVATLAVLKAGAAYVPLDMAAPLSRLRLILDDTAPALVLTVRAAAALDGLGHRVVVLEDLAPRLADADPADRPVAVDREAPAYVMYTSGSTGRPKGVVVPHRGILRLVFGLDALAWVDVTTVLHMAPPSFDASTFEIFGPLLRGRRLVVAAGARVSLDALAAVLATSAVDTLWLTAALFNTVVDERPALLAGVRQVLTGGEAVSAAHVRRAQAALPGLRVVNGYGPTEATTFACCHAVPLLDDAAHSVPIGRPIGGTRVSVRDPRGRLVAPGATGELWIGGEGVALGYHGQPALTAERFVPDPDGDGVALAYRTGDAVRWRPDGTLDFLGRLDRQVKLRGFRIEPGEIEHALRAAVRDAVVECEGQGDAARLVAYVVAGDGPVDASSLRAHLRATLPEYMLPAEFVVLDAVPRTPHGKIDRAALPAAGPAVAPARAGGPPRGGTEAALAALWSELLGGVAVERDADFFLSGGHSLLALRLVDRVHRQLGVRLAPLALFEHPRLADLAACIDARRAPAAGPAMVPAPCPAAARTCSAPQAVAPARASTTLLARMAAGGDGTPFFWVHGVGGEVFSYLPVTKHLARTRPVYGFAADWTTTFSPDERDVERIAAAYVTALLEVRPEGPYHLGGYCSAAVLVLEIARQLEARGHAVGAFTILDYAVADGPPRDGASGIVKFARNLPRWIGDDALATGMADLAGRVKSRVRRLRTRRDESPEAAAGADIRDALGMWRFPDSQVGMLKVHLDVLKAYVPRPFRGRATLLLPRTGPLLGPFPEVQDYGWGAIALDGVDVHSVPGSHSTFLSEPFATTIAGRIEESIRQAEARLGTPAPAGVADAGGPWAEAGLRRG